VKKYSSRRRDNCLPDVPVGRRKVLRLVVVLVLGVLVLDLSVAVAATALLDTEVSATEFVVIVNVVGGLTLGVLGAIALLGQRLLIQVAGV